jgi:hypothetical protein
MPTNTHGGAGRGQGRKPSVATEKKLLDKRRDQFRRAFESSFDHVADRFPELIGLMVDEALGTVDRECPKCHHVYPSPMGDKDLQKFLVKSFMQVNDTGEDADISAIRRIAATIAKAKRSDANTRPEGEPTQATKAAEAAEASDEA